MYNNKTIANKFNTFFANIGLDLCEKIKMPSTKIFQLSYWYTQ